MNLFSEFEKRCEVFNIRNEGITYILAYSGGTDSTALLHLTEKLCKCKGSNQFIVAHYNHTLRPEAEQEIKLIQSLCADNELQLVIGKGDVASEALKLKKSEHDMGRKMRYDFLAECALGVDVKPSDNLPSQTENVILTAHHQDDQIETVLMRLISGAGVDGMAGIEPEMIWKLSNLSQVRVLRPLLDFKKSDILDYCYLNNLNYFEDMSNYDLNYPRNKIRYKLIPYLESEFGSQIRTGIIRSSKNFSQCSRYLSNMTDQMMNKTVLSRTNYDLALDYQKYCSYFAILRYNCIRKIFFSMNTTSHRLSRERCVSVDSHIINKSKGSIEIGCGISVCKHKNIVWFYRNPKSFEHIKIDPLVKVEIQGWGNIKITEIQFDEFKLPPKPNCLFMDKDKIHLSKLQICEAEPGERFQPLGMQGRQKVTSFLYENKVPPHRRKYPLLKVEDRIVAIPPFRIDDSVKISPETTRILKIQWEDR